MRDPRCVARNMNWNWGGHRPIPCPFSPFIPFSFYPSLFPLFVPPTKNRILEIPLAGLGNRCELFQQSLRKARAEIKFGVLSYLNTRSGGKNTIIFLKKLTN